MKRAKPILVLLIAGLVLGSCSVKPRARRATPESDKVVIRFDEPALEGATSDADLLPFLLPAAEQAEEPVIAQKRTEQPLEKASVQEEEIAPESEAKVVAPETEVNEEIVQVEESAAPSASAGRAASSEYRLGYGDVVEIKFFNNPEYNEVVTVRPDGRISLQQIGDLEVVGVSPSELQSLVHQVYGEILKQPDVTVFVREFGGQFFYVMGEVNSPGQFEMSKGMSVLRAIAAAGGAKNSGKLSSVILIRADQNQNVEARRLDLSIADVARDLDKDLTLMPYDMVFVPKTFIANLDVFMQRLWNYVLPPTDLYYRYKYWYRGDL